MEGATQQAPQPDLHSKADFSSGDVSGMP